MRKIFDQLEESFNPDLPLTLLFDYVRIRFPTTDVRKIIQEILHLKFEYMLHEDYAFYSYQEQYVMGDIVVMLSHEEDKGVLLELKGGEDVGNLKLFYSLKSVAGTIFSKIV